MSGNHYLDERDDHEAYWAIQPALAGIRRDMICLRSQGLTPEAVLLPSGYPYKCYGGRAFGLPILLAEYCSRPKVVASL